MESKHSLLCLQEPTTSPCPEPDETNPPNRVLMHSMCTRRSNNNGQLLGTRDVL